MNGKNVRNVILAQLLYISGICDEGKKGKYFFLISWNSPLPFPLYTQKITVIATFLSEASWSKEKPQMQLF